MVIGSRLRGLREARKLSQGDVEKRTGLLRCYISRVENGHTVPAIETLEKMARALEIPMYQLFYDGVEPPQAPPMLPGPSNLKKLDDWAARGRGLRMLMQIRRAMDQMSEENRSLLLDMARKMARR